MLPIISPYTLPVGPARAGPTAARTAGESGGVGGGGRVGRPCGGQCSWWDGRGGARRTGGPDESGGRRAHDEHHRARHPRSGRLHRTGYGRSGR